VKRICGGIAVLAACALSGHAVATVIDLDFNVIGTGNNAAVQSYLDAIAGAGAITVRGAVANQIYNGDGHVFKDGNSIRETLGTSEFVDGVLTPNTANPHHLVYDTFLYNVGGEGSTNTAYGSYGDDKIVFDFATPVTSIAFDWEVFPDASCQLPGFYDGCGPRYTSSNMPDFELWAGTPTSQLYDYHSGDASGDFPVAGSKNGSFPQGIGYFETAFAAGVTHVEFVDWPARIGIDNLQGASRVLSEPPSLALVALQALGFVGWRRKRAEKTA
jgi:hypothetical protein